ESINSYKITDLEGEISDFDKKDDNFLLSSSSYKNDNYLYEICDNKITKIKDGYYRTVTFTNDNNYILYTKFSNYFDNFAYCDLYSYNKKTKKEKQLTKKERINYVNFSKKTEVGLMVSHTPFGSKLYKADFKNGIILNKKEISIPEGISFIDKPAISDDGKIGVISAKTDTGRLKLFIIDIEKGLLNELESVTGRFPQFIDNTRFSFIYEKDQMTRVLIYDFDFKKNYEIVSTIGIIKAKIENDTIFYTKYTHKGIELFSSKIKEQKEFIFENNSEKTQNKNFNLTINNYKIKNYNPFRNWYPTLWGLLPATLPGANLILEPIENGYLNIPFIAPQLFLFNQSTLGRFSYRLSITYDYLRQYPINSLSLYFNNPYISISYDWSSWMSGEVNYLYTLKENGFDYKSYQGRFPINFSNSLNLESNFDINQNSNISFSTHIYHHFNEYDYSKKNMTNKISFNEYFRFYYL
ncbi:MAG TPA: hypothetical protein PK771_15050, partial [Spirochaetota bacterium]|nr:hypothetical protein [Spirochaetota bacterium]